MAGPASESPKTNGELIDTNSPYYLHPSDYPKQLQVNENLTDNNFNDWSQEMTNFLFAKNKISFVDGSLLKPDKNDDKYMQWMRCDAMIKGWLTTAMEKEIRSSVKYANTALEIWNDLHERFGKESAPRAYELKQSVTQTRQERASVSAYFTKLRSIWDEIDSVLPTPRCECNGCSCNIGKKITELKEKERLYEFLMGLDAEFSVMRTQILATKPTPSLGTAYHLVAEDEQQRNIATGKRTTPIPDAAAFQASHQVNRDNQNQRKPWQKSDKAGPNNKTTRCTFCERDGHTRDGCFKLVGYPDWWPGKGKKETSKPKAALAEAGTNKIPGLSDEQYEMFLKLFGKTGDQKTSNTPKANMAGKFNNKGEWILDSGATEYMTHDREFLHNLTIGSKETPVTIPNGETVPVEGIGEFTFKGAVKIKGVLFIPNFKCNLLSVSRLTKDLQCAITFFPDFFVIQGLRTRDLIGTGKCTGGLYRMGAMQEDRKAMAVTTSNQWHKRLGHPSNGKMSHISIFKVTSHNSNEDFCDSCLRAKLTRLPFQTSTIKTNDCFDMIHCDIWGGYRTFSLTHGSYFLTIVDDYSRAVWVYIMKHKYEASEYLISFYNLVQTQFKKNIKRIRCDNGGEFTSNRMKDFYADHGIELETTCPHTPQQNGVVERKHRHLLEIARALRFEGKLPIRFWGECVLTAAYIVNRLPSKVIKYKTPYEILFRRKPSYDHMRVLGCLAYFWNTDTKGDKFAPRGKAGVFLGYPFGTKGYKIYDLEKGKLIVSRDVKFIESVFPLASHKENVDLGDNEIVTEYQQVLVTECHEETSKSNMAENDGDHCDENAKNNSSVVFEQEVINGMDPSIQPDEPNSPPHDPIHADEANRVSQPNADHPRQPIHDTSRRTSQRVKTQPARLKDYEVSMPPSVDHAHPSSDQGSSTVHPLAHYISYDKFSNGHKAFLTAITSHDEPKTFFKASQDEKWREAMKREIKALEENGTWSLEQLPDGKKAIDSKWVYKIKYKPNGEIERYKARLVAKGFTQQEGVDYHDTFAPVAKLVTMRTLLALAVKRDWIIHQLDVNNAFLHGDLNEEVYMKLPQGFSKDDDTRVCRLRKSLYGLKQASRNWYHKFTNALLELGFTQSKADYSLFVYKQNNVFVAALIYVDDVIVVGNDMSMIQYTKAQLHERFSIKDLGTLKYFLGIEVARTKEGLVLSQRKYTLDILEDSGLQGCRPSGFPMEQNLKLDKGEEEQKVDANKYRRLIGRLLYLQATRPDITYSVNVLSQFVSDPRQNHMDAATRVLRYLKSTPGQGILLPRKGGLKLVSYCDADWLGCPLSRRSRTGYLLLLGGAPISWKSKKQSVVSRSSAEAEYRAMATTVSEVLWVRSLLTELHEIPTEGTTLFCDNMAAKHIADNPVFHERTKHVEMDCYFVRERVESKEVRPTYIDTKHQIADLLTKPLGAQHLRSLLVKLGMQDLHAPT
ncbi:hypothetical protein L2E82_50551 [Cichorium intybus]|nr:hypothetical protein L2E82_50551 [Cichorium intybus]